MQLVGIQQTFSSKLPVCQTLFDVAINMVPLWLAVMIGLIVGWSWKPSWASFFVLGLRSKSRLVWSTPPGFGARRIWFALTALTAFQVLKETWNKFKGWKRPEIQLQETTENSNSKASEMWSVVTNEDLKDFCLMLHYRDGGPEWQMLMEHKIPNMTYQAWRRNPLDGPTQYRSRTVFEDVSPEILRDFFWDDEFRLTWDDMLIHAETLEECTHTGIAIVHWIRKFPLFCSNREYIIGRRMWEAGNAFFCITKGVPCLSIPKRSKPRRVESFYSSWYIHAVESTKGDRQRTACEVLLFHYEDVGIPRELVKLGVKQGMWNCVKKMEPALRKYQAARKSLKPLSQSALNPQIITKIPTPLRTLGFSFLGSNEEENICKVKNQPNIWKWVLVGGVVGVACGLDKGILSKLVVFGVERRFRKHRRL